MARLKKNSIETKVKARVCWLCAVDRRAEKVYSKAIKDELHQKKTKERRYLERSRRGSRSYEEAYIRRSLGSDSSESPNNLTLKSFIEKKDEEKRALVDLIKDKPEILKDARYYSAKVFSSGNEHTVYFDEKRGVVVKEALDFGWTPSVEYPDIQNLTRTALGVREALPSEYIQRIDLSNKYFQPAIKLAGLQKNGKPTVTQSFVTGRESTSGEIRDLMERLGFENVSDSKTMLSKRLKGTAWINKKDGVVVVDAREANFITSEDGHVFGIDLMISKTPEQLISVLH